MLLVEIDDGLALALAQQPVVDEHAGELAADGLVEEGGGHGRIDAAAEAEDDAAPARPWPGSPRTACAMKFFIDQSCRAPQTPTRKLRITSTPRSVWNTSG